MLVITRLFRTIILLELSLTTVKSKYIYIYIYIYIPNIFRKHTYIKEQFFKNVIYIDIIHKNLISNFFLSKP